jgi:hypothetical protein
MTEQLITLDSLEKIEQFSKGLPPYTRASTLLSGDTNIPGLFVGGFPVQIQNLLTHVLDKNLEDQDFRIPSFENEVQSTPRKPISDEIGRNLEYLGYPCLKANFTTFASEKRVKYPIIRIVAWTDSNGDIIQVSGDFFINDNRDVNNPKTYFLPFVETERIESEEIPSAKTKEEIDILIKTYATPDLEKCPPPDVSNFYANDQDWGIVPLDTAVIKSVILENRGETTLVVNDFKPKEHPNFKIINLFTPITIQPGKTTSFDVQYSPLEDAEITHKMTIYYDVWENGDPLKPVLGEKTISVLTGTGDKRDPIDDVIDDFDDGVLKDDDNGTYVTKTISKIVDTSAPIEKWKTEGLWACVGDRMYQFYSGSNGTTNDAHYLAVYNKEQGTHGSYHQFDISYGHKSGLGSKLVINGVDTKPSKTMYTKYLVECYEPEGNTSKLRPTKFKFKNGVNGDYAYFIQVDRDRFKHMLDPGNFELSLCPLTSSTNQLINTGSNVRVNQSSSNIFTLIDESWDAKQEQTHGRNLKDWYYVVSGSKRDGVYSEQTDNAWGVVFPNIGLIVLDGAVLDQSCSFNTVTASIDGQNAHKLFMSISGSSAINNSRNYTGSFFARSAEKYMVQTYFCRMRQNEFNYSNNPTYVSGSGNDLKYNYFINNPHSYITSIGLYNKKGTLLAVGKLKRPILKNDTKSYVFQVRVRLS